MNLSCGSRTIKYLMFTFNFFFAITGIILIAVGASIHAYYTQYDVFLNSQYFSLPNLLIATGALIFFICFLGCYGALKNSWILLFLFSVLLGIIFIFEFSAGIAGYVLRDKTTNYLEKSMQDSMQEYPFDKSSTGLWDLIQENFQCCGVASKEDWMGRFPNHSLPISCCPRLNGAINTFTCNSLTIISSSTTTTTTTTVAPPVPVDPALINSTVENNQQAAKLLRKVRQTLPEGGTSLPSATTTTTTTTTTLAPTTTTLAPSSTPPYDVGCVSAFGNWVKAHAVDIGAVCFTLAVLQLIGIGFACHLSQQLKNSYYST